MKIQNAMSQKIGELHKINKKCMLNSHVRLCKSVNFYALSTWLGLLLHELLAQYGVALLGLESLIFLLSANWQQSSTVTAWSLK